uniref:Uncharacterized protein n=1 Tax=Glossina austeni TaxID=7395 RepID=A0A1A9UXT2_GLOAU
MNIVARTNNSSSSSKRQRQQHIFCSNSHSLLTKNTPCSHVAYPANIQHSNTNANHHHYHHHRHRHRHRHRHSHRHRHRYPIPQLPLLLYICNANEYANNRMFVCADSM